MSYKLIHICLVSSLVSSTTSSYVWLLPQDKRAFVVNTLARNKLLSLPLFPKGTADDNYTESSSPIPPPPAVSMPVWSLATPMKQKLATASSESLSTSMNIVTYAMPVSIAPPKLWAVSLYHGTCTKDSFLEHGHGILQLLKPQHKLLVPVLGKHSSHDVGYSKKGESSSLGFDWIRYPNDDERLSSMELLPDCATYIDLQVLPASRSVDAGDHIVVLCQVCGTYEWDGKQIVPSQQSIPLDHTNALYSGLLRQEGII